MPVGVHRLLSMLDQSPRFTHKRPDRKQRGRNVTELLRDSPELKELGISGDEVERLARRLKVSIY